MKLFGLIGNPLSHSYSQEYFTKKFEKENLEDCQYRLFQISDLSELKSLIHSHPDLMGLNVTIPYKKKIINELWKYDELSKAAGAVNCIKIIRKQDSVLLYGFNTDVYGFELSLRSQLKSWHKKALILGTGGSSGAVTYVLNRIGISVVFVSRNPQHPSQIGYKELNGEILADHLLIVNTTPAGMFPDIHTCPEIPYHDLTPDHLLFDLVYNPSETLFLKKGRERGAATINGLEMLCLQAEKSWEIWMKEDQ